MSARHDVPGGWVELRDPDEVPERLRQPIKIVSARLARYPGMRKAGELANAAGVQTADDLNNLDDATQQAIAEEMGDAMEHLDRMQKLTIMSRVSAWSFGPEVTMDGLLDLPAKTYDAVEKLCGTVEELVADLGPSPDPNSPTQPSTV